MRSYRTPFHGYSVKWSPFNATLIACATSQHYGIVGNGKLLVGNALPELLEPLGEFDTLDGCFDCAWSEHNESQLATCCGDGSVKLYDIRRAPHENPLTGWKEHTGEVQCIEWNGRATECFLTASWDRTVKVWNAYAPQSIVTLSQHSDPVNAAVFSPHDASTLVSVSGETARMWDVRSGRMTQMIYAHSREVLTCDWSKYNAYEIATGSVDRTIKVWDVRRTDRALTRLAGHAYAVRRLRYSPFDASVIASCSYDMTVRVWDYENLDMPLLNTFEHHTEFSVGIDFNLFERNIIASCGWDQTIGVWKCL